MLKTILMSLFLVTSPTSVAKSQVQDSGRPTPVVIDVSASVVYTNAPGTRDVSAPGSRDDSRRFAVRTAADDEDLNWCRRDRMSCVVGAASAIGMAAAFLGSSLAHSPKYHTVDTSIGQIEQCVAHCNEKQDKQVQFGLTGVIIGAIAGFVLSR